MNKWYISIQNKARGPFTDLQMKKKIEEGEIEGLTLTYKEGATDWLPLEKQEIWIEDKKKISKPHHNESLEADVSQWILLVENRDKKGQFLQKGPYNDTEVRELISKGEVQLKDYCWKQGMTDWKLLFETVELGLTRKPKIEFSSPSASVKNQDPELDSFQQELDLEPLPQIEMNFVENDLEEVSEAITSSKGASFDEELTLKNISTENLTEEPDELEEEPVLPRVPGRDLMFRRVSLSFVTLALFGIGVFVGLNKKSLPVTSSTYNVSSFFKDFSLLRGVFVKPNKPKASYVLIKHLMSDPQNVLIRSDAKADQTIKVSLLDKDRKTVPLKKGGDYLEVKTNVFGEAFVDLSVFKLVEDQSYKLSAQIGSLRAQKRYTFGPSE